MFHDCNFIKTKRCKMIVIETFKGKSVTEHSVEIAERKGTGHPDYMCDSIMDAILQRVNILSVNIKFRFQSYALWFSRFPCLSKI